MSLSCHVAAMLLIDAEHVKVPLVHLVAKKSSDLLSDLEAFNTYTKDSHFYA